MVGLAVVWNTAPAMVKRLQAGEQGDVLLLNKTGVETMKAMGRLADDSIKPIASAVTAVAIKAGAKRPDISSPASFKQALLAAKSISYSHPDAGGASGIYIAKLLKEWGIDREINAKTKFPPPAGLCAKFLLTGEAELAIQQKSELLQVKGIDIVGPLPGDLHFVTHFVAGVDTQSTRMALAASFIDLLRTPEARALFAAAVLRRLGDPPLLVDIFPDPGMDDDHVLAVFKIDGCWGAIAKSNYSGLRFREPVYRTLPGWKTPLSDLPSLEAFPPKALDYLAVLGDLLSVEVAIVSVGPERRRIEDEAFPYCHQ